MSEQSKGATPPRRRVLSVTWAFLAATVLLGAATRFYRLGALPPGLYHDEALNGLDALRILAGERPVFFEANNGREPFFFYCMALALSLLGRTPIAVRVAAAVLGTLTVPATFLMARALFDERVGLWSAWLIAVAPWPINLSRIGLRAVSMPLVTSLALWLWWSGRDRERRVWRTIVGGGMLGLSLYTYTAARFVPVAVGAFVLFQTWVRRERLDRRDLWAALAALLAMMPLIMYGAMHWESFAERLSQVSILSPDIHHGDPVGLLVRNVFRAAGLFTFYGDAIPRHNVPSRPLFDPVIAVFFLLGVLLSLRGRRGGAHALALIWTGVMLVPTIMAEDCPHFLRAVGVLPMAAVFPALGLEWVRERLQSRASRWVGWLLICAALATAAGWGLSDYWLRYGGDPDLASWFEADQVQAAVEINQFLGSGWQGVGAFEPRSDPIPGRQVVLAPRIWEDRFAVNLLLGSPERVSILGRDTPPPDGDAVLVLAWPYEDMRLVHQALPHPARIQVWPGPLERGDLDPEPRLLYVAYRGERLDGEQSVPAARFEGGIELLGWQADPQQDGRTVVRLRWRTENNLDVDYTVFVHLVSDGSVIAQADGTPGGGFYPTTWWAPGDEIVDEHTLDRPYDPAAQVLTVGWYELSSMQHLRVLGEENQPGADRLTIHRAAGP